MKKQDAGSWLWLIGRIFLAVVFLYAGAVKVLEPVENFQGQIAEYQVVPYGMIAPIALIFPWLELIFGTFLLVGFAPRVSALMLGIFAASFLFLIAASYFRNGVLPPNCGCFGQEGVHLTPGQVILLDVLNFFLGVRLFMLESHRWSLDSWLKREAP